MKVLRADFSQLMIPGRYYVSVAGSLEPSPVFEIGWRIYKPVLLMRSNGTLRDVSHGWYDAGDCGKYVPAAAEPIVDQLLAYEAFPVVFGDENSIPESGNGKPDVLDEVKWELDWMLKMQDAESGGFYHSVSPIDAPRQIFGELYKNPSDEVDGLPAGIMVEGPNQYQGWYYSRFVGKCYVDTNSNWTISEIGIGFNSSLVFVLALADATAWVPAF